MRKYIASFQALGNVTDVFGVSDSDDSNETIRRQTNDCPGCHLWSCDHLVSCRERQWLIGRCINMDLSALSKFFQNFEKVCFLEYLVNLLLKKKLDETACSLYIYIYIYILYIIYLYIYIYIILYIYIYWFIYKLKPITSRSAENLLF